MGGLSPGREALCVPGCWPVDRRLLVSVNPFHARHCREPVWNTQFFGWAGLNLPHQGVIFDATNAQKMMKCRLAAMAHQNWRLIAKQKHTAVMRAQNNETIGFRFVCDAIRIEIPSALCNKSFFWQFGKSHAIFEQAQNRGHWFA